MIPRVLVLEANADLRSLMAMALRNAGYECEVARGDGLGALRDTPGPRRRRPPAAIVLGLPPERAAGVTLSRAAKACWPGVPLVVLVSDPSSRLRDGCLAAGAGAVLCHPLELQTLAEAIERLLGDGPAAPARSLSAEAGRPSAAARAEAFVIRVRVGDAGDRRRSRREDTTRGVHRAA